MGSVVTKSKGKTTAEVVVSKKKKRVCNVYLQWSKPFVTGVPPSGRYAHTMSVVGDKIYIFGGFCGHYDNSLFILDTESMSWIKPEVKGNAPSGRAFHTAAIVDEKIYYFGGFDGRANLNDLHILDTRILKWSRAIVRGTQPGARFEGSIVACDTMIYLFGGGNTQSFTSDIFTYDTETGLWTLLPAEGSPPKGRCAHNLCISDDKTLIIHGGYDGTKRLSDTRTFKIESMEWIDAPLTRSPSFPGKRAAHVAVLIGNHMHVHGGFNGKKRLNDVSMMNLETGTWHSPCVFGSGPSGRSYHAACVMEKTMVMFGGFDGIQRSNELFVLQEVLPSLVHLCITYIIRNKPKVGSLKKLPLELRQLVE